MAHVGHAPAVDRLHAHDIKLETDRLSEIAIVDTVRAAFPGHRIHAEEGGELPGEDDCVWLVDPLDGTMNYAQGFHYFCSCIACYRRPAGLPATGLAGLGEPLVGVVHAPALDQLFVGVAGRSATLNGQPLRIAPALSLADAVVGVSLGSEEKTMARMLSVVASLLRRCRKLRLFGACGLDVANVAAGRLSALVQRQVRCWDFAAARVILEAAGGVVDALAIGPDRWDVLACVPDLHAPLLDLLGDRR